MKVAPFNGLHFSKKAYYSADTTLSLCLQQEAKLNLLTED